ncbi:glutamate-aspartate carrier protein [Thamnocephalis sphaerospora]|uniref:Amino acid transporter n=1 Tax=Thamnocephalis sphaerospora TaxID=78915 RepID=A0A4P9XJG2_9FUNG|nr:glutamate-aspartate carrier protein [Thamnocephalis sphaerospora]|eukprot:RKP05330.1 glutamate-aspartate carrier protein [Thamnocephalis sphaerospora]
MSSPLHDQPPMLQSGNEETDVHQNEPATKKEPGKIKGKLARVGNTVRRPFAFCWRFLLKIKLSYWILISMVVGLLIGWLAPGFGKDIKPLSEVFLRMIKSLIVPLLFSTLVVGVAGHGDDLASVGRMFLKAIIYFEVVTTIALALGLIAVNITRPGDGVSIEGKDESQGKELAKKEITWEHELFAIVPESFFAAAAENQVLQIVVASIVFAIGIIKVKDGKFKRPMLAFCESLSEIMFKVTGIVMGFAPIGIGAAMAATVGANGISVLAALGKLIGTLYGALAVFLLIVALPIILMTRIPLRDFLKAVGKPVLIGFSTASSEAALPLAMENLYDLGCARKVVAFVLPTGYSFNLDGTTLYLSLAAVFCAQVAGMELPISRQIVIMLTLMLTSKGVAGVPRASLVVLSGALAQYDIPMEGIALIMGVDSIMDMARTATNLLGNCLATVVVAKWEKEFRSPSWYEERNAPITEDEESMTEKHA